MYVVNVYSSIRLFKFMTQKVVTRFLFDEFLFGLIVMSASENFRSQECVLSRIFISSNFRFHEYLRHVTPQNHYTDPTCKVSCF